MPSLQVFPLRTSVSPPVHFTFSPSPLRLLTSWPLLSSSGETKPSVQLPPSLLHSSSPHSAFHSTVCLLLPLSLPPSLLSLEVCPSTSGEAGPLGDNRSSVTPLLLLSVSLSLSLTRSLFAVVEVRLHSEEMLAADGGIS